MTITVRGRVGDIELVVEDDGDRATARARGHGLVGMEERAKLLGGDLEAGPDAHGWTVRARVPRG